MTEPERRPDEPGSPARRRRPTIHVLLFVATLATTSLAGALNDGADVFNNPAAILRGLPFSLTLMTILLVHEMGHYSMARRHHVAATLPYFIPAPPPVPVGTFGAFIRMDVPPDNRRALFDVGAAGPWAGLLATIPAILLGLSWSELRPRQLLQGGLELGEPILFQALSWLAFGPIRNDMTVVLHPVALAGWFGLFVTFINLLPIGQLDGGHVAYAMFGRHHRWIARAFLATILVLGYIGWPGWFVWALLIYTLGIDHPPTLDPWIGLDRRRILAGWVTVAALMLTFMPIPFAVVEPPPENEVQRTPVRCTDPPVGNDRFLPGKGTVEA